MILVFLFLFSLHFSFCFFLVDGEVYCLCISGGVCEKPKTMGAMYRMIALQICWMKCSLFLVR